jgi:uncharacterized protein (TIGR02145 family)
MKITLTLVFLLSSIVSFTQQTGTITDARDGKVYKTVVIGTQTWMSENLNVSTFRNGDRIPEAKTNEEWLMAAENEQPAWCYFNNDPLNQTKFGKLYNWYAVNDSRGLAPNGWVIPSYLDWENLIKKMGGIVVSNEIPLMKFIKVFSEDFKIVAGGSRNDNGDGEFHNKGKTGIWWNLDDGNTCFAWFENILATDVKLINTKVNQYNVNTSFFVAPSGGFSVRCIKD